MERDAEESDSIGAPGSHPDPDRWWREIKWQARFCLLAIAGLGGALIRWGLDDAASLPMTVLAIGLVAGAAAFGGGSTIVDFAKAWRGKS